MKLLLHLLLHVFFMFGYGSSDEQLLFRLILLLSLPHGGHEFFAFITRCYLPLFRPIAAASIIFLTVLQRAYAGLNQTINKSSTFTQERRRRGGGDECTMYLGYNLSDK